jgi:periplasmic protein CpxP/Spy
MFGATEVLPFDKTLLALTLFLTPFGGHLCSYIQSNFLNFEKSGVTMKSFVSRLLIASAAVLIGTALSQAQAASDASAPPPMHGHEFGMGEPMMHFFAEKLDLTDQQKEQLKSIMQKERPTIHPLMQQSHAIDQQLRGYAEGTYDEAKVRALANQKAQIEAELTVQRTRIHNEVFQLLTPDQQAKAKELEAQHEEHFRAHMHQATPPPSQDQE